MLMTFNYTKTNFTRRFTNVLSNQALMLQVQYFGPTMCMYMCVPPPR